MSAFFAEYGLFLLKAVTVVVAFAIILITLVASIARARKSGGGGSSEGHIEIRKFNESLEDMEESLSMALLDEPMRKQIHKDRKAADKAEAKAAKKAAKLASKQRGAGETIVSDNARPRLFVLDFHGDIRASAVESMRREITAVLTDAKPEDEVLIRLESGGGMVTSYGLAASQLDRIRAKKIPLTISVDKVAASGGYMMACVGDKVLAAPFAVLGSIGVVAQIPNFHRLLRDNKVDFEMLTAGKYKRTLTMFGENTDEGREKFMEDIERIHDQFKGYVQTRRPSLDIDKVATGEIWSGEDAIELKLADRLATSDDYMVEATEERDVLLVKFKEKKSLASRFSMGAESAVDRLLMRWLDRVMKMRFSIG